MYDIYEYLEISSGKLSFNYKRNWSWYLFSPHTPSMTNFSSLFVRHYLRGIHVHSPHLPHKKTHLINALKAICTVRTPFLHLFHLFIASMNGTYFMKVGWRLLDLRVSWHLLILLQCYPTYSSETSFQVEMWPCLMDVLVYNQYLYLLLSCCVILRFNNFVCL